ncbi:MAG: hypothetical protein ISS28_06440 [Candidatus Cloacimonetes bacterium]|nr:hypothetical protein [Candidatus Cloacimonadota bacterium]
MKKLEKKETPRERFERLAEFRTNEVLKKLKILGNCSNKQLYNYTKKDINHIFNTIEKKVNETKIRFSLSQQKNDEFKI